MCFSRAAIKVRINKVKKVTRVIVREAAVGGTKGTDEGEIRGMIIREGIKIGEITRISRGDITRTSNEEITSKTTKTKVAIRGAAEFRVDGTRVAMKGEIGTREAGEAITTGATGIR